MLNNVYAFQSTCANKRFFSRMEGNNDTYCIQNGVYVIIVIKMLYQLAPLKPVGVQTHFRHLYSRFNYKLFVVCLLNKRDWTIICTYCIQNGVYVTVNTQILYIFIQITAQTGIQTHVSHLHWRLNQFLSFISCPEQYKTYTLTY